MPTASPYTYPRPLADYGKSLNKKDTDPYMLAPVEFAATKPKMTTRPYTRSYDSTKLYTHMMMANPLDEILACSRKQILAYQLKLPYPSERELASDPHSVTHNDAIKEHSKILPGMDLAPNLATLVPSSSGSLELHAPSFLPENGAKNITHEPEIVSKSLDDEVADPLACHANNILRMAMDTTMMGSFCNSSISLNFLNLVDESMYKLAEGIERSKLGGKKSGLLNLHKAAKIEISAADLEDAINNPLR